MHQHKDPEGNPLAFGKVYLFKEGVKYIYELDKHGYSHVDQKITLPSVMVIEDSNGWVMETMEFN